LRTVPALIAPAHRRQFRKQLRNLREWRERGEFGGDIGELGGHAALERQRRETSRLLRDFTALAAREPTNTKRHVAEEERNVTDRYPLRDKVDSQCARHRKRSPIVAACAQTISV
jgi:hypothetical protein